MCRKRHHRLRIFFHVIFVWNSVSFSWKVTKTPSACIGYRTTYSMRSSMHCAWWLLGLLGRTYMIRSTVRRKLFQRIIIPVSVFCCGFALSFFLVFPPWPCFMCVCLLRLRAVSQLRERCGANVNTFARLGSDPRLGGGRQQTASPRVNSAVRTGLSYSLYYFLSFAPWFYTQIKNKIWNRPSHRCLLSISLRLIGLLGWNQESSVLLKLPAFCFDIIHREEHRIHSFAHYH